MAITRNRLSGALGLRLSGVDFAGGLSPALLGEIVDALVEHQVVAIDAPGLTPEQQLEIARAFGEPEHHVFFPNLGPGLEHVTVLDSLAGERADRWHTDESFLPDPPIVSTLHAQILPEFGGDTAFLSMQAAYDALSPRMQAYVEGLTALFDFTKIAELSWVRGNAGGEKMAQFSSQHRYAEHPLIKVHPASGRKSIYFDTMYLRHIADLPELEGRQLIEFLGKHVQRPEFGYRHVWRANDLLLWDNRSVMHYAVADFTGHRRMHRISVMPSPSIAAAA